MANRFYTVRSNNGNSYLVNVDHVVALKEKGREYAEGGVLYIANGKIGDGGGALVLELSQTEAAGVRDWLFSQ